MIVQFIDRDDELRTLNKLAGKGDAALVLLYGRRRVGKTRLVQEFMKNRQGMYFYVPNAEEKMILTEFSRVVEGEFFEGFRFADIASFLGYIAKKCGNGVVVAIDEFQRLANVDGGMSMLQKYWDEKLVSAKCFMILSGSSIGAIRRVALSGDAPLYGRRTATLKIEPLKYLDLFEWFRERSPEELVKIYGSFGGTPAYLEHVDGNLSVEDNIVEKILNVHSPLHGEPEMLLMEEIRAPQRYMDMLSAVASGRNTISQIADMTGLSRENSTTYLKSLEILDLIERVTPVTSHEAKRGLYRIRDFFFSFWFRFVRPNERQLEMGLVKNVWEAAEEGFNAYLGWVFEEVGREVLAEMAKRSMLPLRLERIGRWWWKKTEIDLLGLEKRNKKALAVEVKWAELRYKEAKRLLTNLAVKAQQVREAEECVLGVMAKRVEDKEQIRKEGFLVLDLQDIEGFARSTKKTA